MAVGEGHSIRLSADIRCSGRLTSGCVLCAVCRRRTLRYNGAIQCSGRAVIDAPNGALASDMIALMRRHYLT